MFGIIDVGDVFERRLLCWPRLHLFDEKYTKKRNMKYIRIENNSSF